MPTPKLSLVPKAYTSIGVIICVCILSCVGGCYLHAQRAPRASTHQVVTELVSIPAGSFAMGDINGPPSEYPERQVRLSAYGIDRTEVTNAAFGACIEAGVCSQLPHLKSLKRGAESLPVVGVSWFDAATFCEWVGRRLPTEAEWEYAARGKDKRRWPWSNRFDPLKANTRGSDDGFAQLAPVGRFPLGASPFGVLDLSGNVAEWTADYFEPTEYRRTSLSVTDPKGPADGRDKVIRGGSWADGPFSVRTASRVGKGPTEIDDTTGFRCAASVSLRHEN